MDPLTFKAMLALATVAGSAYGFSRCDNAWLNAGLLIISVLTLSYLTC